MAETLQYCKAIIPQLKIVFKVCQDNPQNGKKYLQTADWQVINLQNLQTAHAAQYQKTKNPIKNGQKI